MCIRDRRELADDYAGYNLHEIYQKLHIFCAGDLGGFYLDVIKDRQYTTKANSVARRSAQTAMFHILEAIVRWLAPILSFTAEEIWEHMPGEREPSVHLATWYQGLFEMGTEEALGRGFWQQVLEVRVAVSKELERLRVAGGIGSSLDAEVDLFCGTELFAQLRTLEDELRFVLISSEARVHRDTANEDDLVHFTLSTGDEVWIAVAPSAHEKCARCWHHREDVGSYPAHPDLCGRCVDNVAGAGEVRRFA
mgnify:FL=1